MTSLHRLRFVAFCAVPALVLIAVLGWVPGLGAVDRWALGFLVLLAALVGHEIHARLRGEASLEDRLVRLTEQQRQTAREVRRLGEVPPEKSHDVGAVIAEVKVLQRLIEQLYAGRAAPALEAPPPSGPAPVDGAEAPAHRLVLDDPAQQAVLDALRGGLKEDRVELVLQPIVGLPQRKRRHFECFSWVRTGADSFLKPEQYIALAEQSGLLNAVDNMLLIRCIQLLRKVRHANPAVAFFCNISANTLADRAFFADFVTFMQQNAELASSIVFEFPQRVIAKAEPALWRDLDELAGLGFRYSLDQVTDLGFDAEMLARRHFRFVKLEAARLVPGGSDAPNGLDARELKRRLDRCGLDLVVEKIEDEATLVELLDLAIDYGQGYLFGEPRLARSER